MGRNLYHFWIYHEGYEESVLMLMKRMGVHSGLVVKVGISICVLLVYYKLLFSSLIKMGQTILI
ncbi:hypothetical protein Lalb_Chr24g0398841 [Lupinus albus]|uniref:Uncharacterized protein n=1 Tax=Lupinus albus TaxID=3870 RepID=A0A6A4N7X2_LUPAL|nr:hypothetical protein Lalb_Chr24g0398841 [Lupinus albus]